MNRAKFCEARPGETSAIEWKSNVDLIRTPPTSLPIFNTTVYRKLGTSIHIIHRRVHPRCWVPRSVKIISHQVQLGQYIRHYINLNIINNIRTTRQRGRQSIKPPRPLPQLIQRIPNIFQKQTVIHRILRSATVIGIPRIFPININSIKVIRFN